MIERIITDNSSEKIRLTWDGERFALIQTSRLDLDSKIIILNPNEMMSVVKFAGNLGG